MCVCHLWFQCFLWFKHDSQWQKQIFAHSQYWNISIRASNVFENTDILKYRTFSEILRPKYYTAGWKPGHHTEAGDLILLYLEFFSLECGTPLHVWQLCSFIALYQLNTTGTLLSLSLFFVSLFVSVLIVVLKERNFISLCTSIAYGENDNKFYLKLEYGDKNPTFSDTLLEGIHNV